MTTKKLEEKILALEKKFCNCCKVLPTTDGIPTEAPTNGQTVKVDFSAGIIYYYDSDTNTWESISGGGGFFTSSINPIATPVAQDANFSVYDIDNLDQLNINAEVGGQIILTTEGITGDSSVGIIDGSIVLGYTGDDLTYSSIIVSNDIVSLGTTNGQIYLSDGGVNYANPPQDDTKDFIVVLDTTTGRAYLRNAATIGGGTTYEEVTYAAAEALIAGSTLVPGTLYKITDRGDRGIFLKALSANQFSETGIRIMLVPKTYQTAIVDGNTWLGIWQPSLTPSIGDLVIWGAHVWENVSGNVGANANEVTLDAEWLLVDKEAYSNDEYIEMIFNVSYDFSNDWISKQWDGKGNKVGVPFEYTSNFNDYGYNFCDITDWNYATSGVPFVDNEAVVIFNNIIEESFAGNKSYGYEISGNTARAMYNNICVGGIIANVVDGRIYDNIVYSFEENVIGGSMIDNFTGNTIGQNTVTGSISFNTTMSSITYNTCNNVIYNTCIGRIESNIVSGNISYNSNSGAIYSNINSTVISYNSNAGDITENTGTGNISYNSNAGHISSNDCEEIYYNSNSGSIASNSNTGAITYNSNNGTVNINSNQGDIYLNSNNGSVADNSNSGDILNNSNNGNIETNSHNGNIIYNSNNGYIANCVGAGGFGVFNNINNGNINNPAGLAAADITDVIVNK